MSVDNKTGGLEAKANGMNDVELERVYAELQSANQEISTLTTQVRELSDELDRHIRVDALTGVHNPRALEGQILLEFSRARRFKRDLTLVIAEVDNFQLITDEFSTQVRDELVKQIAGILRESCRFIDFVARYDGCKFVMLLIETPVHKARMLCEKIRVVMEQFEWQSIDPKLHVTISMGLTDDLALENPLEMLPEANKILEEAQSAGGNQIASR